jgi:AraC family transcriptional activator of pobA
MNKPEIIEDLCEKIIDWIPESICKYIGHFNVFRLESYSLHNTRPISSMHRDYYKIMLLTGDSKIHHANKVIQVKKQSLVFTNPKIPCKWEHSGSNVSGYYCLFNPDFFYQYECFNQYEVFQADGIHAFDLSKEQANKVAGYYERMLKEIDSNYIYKYDVLRNLVYEVLHFVIKMQSKTGSTKSYPH